MDSVEGARAYLLECAPRSYVQRVLAGLLMYSCSSVGIVLSDVFTATAVDRSARGADLAWWMASRIGPQVAMLLSVLWVIVPPRERRLCRYPWPLIFTTPVCLAMVVTSKTLSWLWLIDWFGVLTTPRLPPWAWSLLSCIDLVGNGAIQSAMLVMCGWLLMRGQRRSLALAMAVSGIVFPMMLITVVFFFADSLDPRIAYLVTPFLVGVCVVVIWRTYTQRLRTLREATGGDA